MRPPLAFIRATFTESTEGGTRSLTGGGRTTRVVRVFYSFYNLNKEWVPAQSLATEPPIQDSRPISDVRLLVDAGVGEVIASSFDHPAQRHVALAELTLERARRRVELGHDVVLIVDSLTRLARAYNTVEKGTGRTLSGGLDAQSLEKPKRFLGSARRIDSAQGAGSLTIIATALVDTGSRMDQVIFEEFKGTGNMELHLDRALQEKRVYPAIHPMLSATRREELLYHPEEWERVLMLRKTMAALPPLESMEKLIDNLQATKTNAELLLSGLR